MAAINEWTSNRAHFFFKLPFPLKSTCSIVLLYAVTIYLSIFLSICQSVFIYIAIPIYPSIHLFYPFDIYLSICCMFLISIYLLYAFNIYLLYAFTIYSMLLVYTIYTVRTKKPNQFNPEKNIYVRLDST